MLQDLTDDGRLILQDPVKGIHGIDGELRIIRRSEKSHMVALQLLRDRSHWLAFDRLAIVRTVRSDHNPAFTVFLADDGFVFRVQQIDFESGIESHTGKGPLIDELPVDHTLIQNPFERISQFPEQLAHKGEGFRGLETASLIELHETGNAGNRPPLGLERFNQLGGEKGFVGGDGLHQDPR